MGLIITLILIVAIFYQVYMFIACKGRVSKFNEELYSNLDADKLRLNDYDSNVLSLPYGMGKGDKIEKVLFHLYGRYYIDKVGMVKRKSNLDKEIEGYFKTVEDRDNQNRLNNSRKYKKKVEEPKKEKKSTLQVIDENSEPVLPEDIRTLFEEIRSGKVIHMDGKEWKLVEHDPDSIENQLDSMLRDSIEKD